MYHIIVNPVAKSGLVKKIRLRVHHTLSLRYLPFRSYTTSYHGHARALAAQIISAPWDSQEDSLIAICGDGTVNEDLNGIRHLERVPFGYIGTGSVNDCSRGLGLPAAPSAALDFILKKAESRPTDVGTVACGGI